MKLNFFSLAALVAASGWQAMAQTNTPIPQTNAPSEFRMVNGKVYDVNKSQEWITVLIPQFSAVRNTGAPYPVMPRPVFGAQYHNTWPTPASPPAAKALTFDGTIKPQTIVFQVPAVYNFTTTTFAIIEHFPYSVSNFQSGNFQAGILHDQNVGGLQRSESLSVIMAPGLVLSKPMRLRLFPFSHPQTNFDAYGGATIVPAKPHFDYGLPVTNSPAQTK